LGELLRWLLESDSSSHGRFRSRRRHANRRLQGGRARKQSCPFAYAEPVVARALAGHLVKRAPDRDVAIAPVRPIGYSDENDRAELAHHRARAGAVRMAADPRLVVMPGGRVAIVIRRIDLIRESRCRFQRMPAKVFEGGRSTG
jgi:hypothetical protein